MTGRRAWRPSRLRFTREGKLFVAIALALGFAAVNTGNNLLYLLLGALLGLILASGVLSEVALHGLRVERQALPPVFAGRPACFGARLANLKRRLASWSLQIEDRAAGGAAGTEWIPRLPGGAELRVAYECTFPRRGRHRLDGFRISTSFPFGLFRKWRERPQPAEVIVYPAPIPTPLAPALAREATGDAARAHRTRRGEYHGLRDFAAGDDPRDVHWRSTARSGRLVVREYERDDARRVVLVVDNSLPAGAGAEGLEAVERAIGRAAFLALRLLERGDAVGLAARGAAIAPAATPAQAAVILQALALLPIVQGAEVPLAAVPAAAVRVVVAP